MSYAPPQDTDGSAAEDMRRIQRIAQMRREIAVLATTHRRAYHLYSDMLWEWFEHALIVEPDGAGLPWVVQSARELITTP